MKSRFLIGGLILILSFSCNRKQKNIDRKKVDVLLFDSLNSVVLDSSLNELKSLKFEYYIDKITVASIYLKRTYVNDYFLKGNMLLDSRKKLLGGFDTIPFFAKKDTAFIYDEFKDGAYIPFLFGLNKQAAEFTIKKQGKIHIRTLHSLYVPSYFEKYYYDDNFHIIRFEYTYKKNKYVFKKVYN